MKITLTKVTNLLNKVTKLLVPFVAISLLLGIIFGTSAPFIGDVYQNVSDILNLLGQTIAGACSTTNYFNSFKERLNNGGMVN